MSDDTKNVVLVFLSIIVVLVIVLGGTFVYLNYGDLSFNNSKGKTIIPNKSNLEEKEIVISLDDENVKKLIPIFSNRLLDRENDKYSNYFYKNDTTSIVDTDLSFRIWLILSKLDFPKVINETTIKKEYQSIFGSLNGYKQITSIDNCYKYGFDNSKFTRDDGECNLNASTISKIAYARNTISKKVDIIDIYEYVVFKEDNSYYSDYRKEKLIVEDVNSEIEDIFSSYQDKLGLYKYRFTKENGNYVFTSVEKVK